MSREANEMKDLLATIVTALVSHPDMVRIDHHDQGNTVLLEVHVDPEDMGKIIGKQGRTVKALRTLLSAACAKNGLKYSLEVVE